MTLRLKLVLTALLAALVAPFAIASTAGAHTGKQSYVYLEIFDTAIAGRVEYPIADLNRVLGLDIPLSSEGSLEALEENAEEIQEYTREHLAIGPADGSTEWTLEFGEVDYLDISTLSYAIFEFEVTERLDPAPRTFRLAYDAIIEAGDRDGFLLIATDWGSGTFNNEGDEFLRYSENNTDQIVDLDDTSWFRGMSGVVVLGADHIRIGTDHILFVLALVLPSVLVFARKRGEAKAEWQPSSSFGSTLWRVMKIVTMFTVAHSITLALGGLGIVELSPRFVETVIALSIAAAALHNIHPIFVNKEWALAFGFGLFHGFGFAGLLADLGLDRSRRVPSLLGFNIGVEFGQSAIILMVFPMLFIMRRSPLYVPLMKAGSVLLSLIAMAWATERIFDYDTSVNSLVEPVLLWPRSAFVVAACYVFAIVLWWDARRRDALVPVVQDADADPAVSDEPEPELVRT
jgi:hypothetical protein